MSQNSTYINSLTNEPVFKRLLRVARVAAAFALLTGATSASAAIPTGNIYAVVPNYDGITSYGGSFYGKFNPAEGTMDVILRSATLSNGQEAYMQSGFVRDDILYIPQVHYGDMSITSDAPSVAWKRFDLSNGKTLSPLNFGNEGEAYLMFAYGLTYDPIHDIAYGLNYDINSGQGGTVFSVDCSLPENEWKATPILDAGGTSDNWMAGICYNPLDERLYGLNNLGQLCVIDTANGAVNIVKSYPSTSRFCFPETMTATPMCYSPHDKSIIYIYANSDDDCFQACSIDMSTLEADVISTLTPRMMVGTLHCSDAFAPDEAPGLMEIPAIDFRDSELKGTYTFTAPTTYYDGTPLERNVTLHVLVDDEEILSQEVAPGLTVSNPVEVPQGLHTFRGYCSLGNLNGPSVSKKMYVGFDRPLPPTSLRLENNMLSWTAPAERGVNNAFIDLSEATYDIHIDGEKVNTEPIAATEYPLEIQTPAEGRREINVTITANGLTSEPSAGLSRVLGKGYALPLSLTPTEEEADLFDTYNANRDAYQWTFTNYAGQEPNFQIYTTDYKVAPDDWLFLPPAYLDSACCTYDLSAAYVNARRNPTMKDNLDIFIGKDPLPQSMTKLIYSHTARQQGEETDLEANFAVDTPGTYFIGFHSKPGDDTRYRGICLRDFRIRKADTTSAATIESGDPLSSAIYYNLQGMRVDNPSKGVYVKVINGKASKIIL